MRDLLPSGSTSPTPSNSTTTFLSERKSSREGDVGINLSYSKGIHGSRSQMFYGWIPIARETLIGIPFHINVILSFKALSSLIRGSPPQTLPPNKGSTCPSDLIPGSQVQRTVCYHCTSERVFVFTWEVCLGPPLPSQVTPRQPFYLRECPAERGM